MDNIHAPCIVKAAAIISRKNLKAGFLLLFTSRKCMHKVPWVPMLRKYLNALIVVTNIFVRLNYGYTCSQSMSIEIEIVPNRGKLGSFNTEQIQSCKRRVLPLQTLLLGFTLPASLAVLEDILPDILPAKLVLTHPGPCICSVTVL